ncbi:HAMP domain-containing histidine kinase [Salinibacterium sp. NSLL150]|uniref:sensor histidine kinase n=1 Tax=unclassified Salinibacterium TaxID=2632331 RepID=UPI0018CEFA7F|nr:MULTISPECIES: HAMP domain-containing sensor histidine kinase [unclassified Salinibacterium]MBH0098436.1 HAMP domain-containing histidine kinase [Salinibacterium sp. NSLL35]MBH0101191.1 HAMP domain-containing histidine kinase [Salinibacterium sp. NSLL150]MBH0103950.1 HAMP domain-containing histidine kinase [Salinibacterium sp. NSLL16]MBH0106711.1 HAMP domain-containing histidine kinase [Salinibacterium sp. NSLL17]MBH0109518.1 HAMP domain-containing histidine kinase [Salinibacterium sp. NG22]
MQENIPDAWSRISLRTKVTGVTVLLLTMGLLVAGVGTAAVLRDYLIEQTDDKITAAADGLDGRIQYTGTTRDPQCSVSRLPNDLYFAVLNHDGSMRCNSREEDASRPVLDGLTIAVANSQTAPFTLPSTAIGGQWRVIAYPAISTIGPDFVTIVIARDLSDSNAIVARYAAIFLFFGLTVVIVGGALTRLLVTSTFAPLREVEATAARFADGDFDQRLSVATPNTEVGRLNRSLNSMLGRIDRAFADRARTIDQMRRFVGDASHELRTPLVTVRGYAELYRMGAITKSDDIAQAMERIEKEAIRMGGLVEDLLELARIDGSKPVQFTEVDLLPLANDAAMDARASTGRVVTVINTNPRIDSDAIVKADLTADADTDTKVITLPESSHPDPSTPSRGVAALATGPIAAAGARLSRLASRKKSAAVAKATARLTQAIAPVPKDLNAVVMAEENKIRQVLTNLVTNALRFTTDTPVEIGVGVDHERQLAVLSVIDHGEGIPEQIRAKVFERFWRADSSRNRDTGGSGLGLAIVAAIVTAHHGTVQALETPGGGATFRVELPLLPSTPSPSDDTEAE